MSVTGGRTLGSSRALYPGENSVNTGIQILTLKQHCAGQTGLRGWVLQLKLWWSRALGFLIFGREKDREGIALLLSVAELAFYSSLKGHLFTEGEPCMHLFLKETKGGYTLLNSSDFCDYTVIEICKYVWTISFFTLFPIHFLKNSTCLYECRMV